MNSVLLAESWSAALSKHLIEQEDKDKEGGDEGTQKDQIYNIRLSLLNDDSVVKV